MAKIHRIPSTIHQGRIIAGNSVPDDIVWDPENPLRVNGCSGHAEEHTLECKGDCDKLDMDELDIRIENERRAWARVGMDTSNYQANQLRQDIQLQTITQILQDKLGITIKDFNAVFKPLMLEHMMEVRKMTEVGRQQHQARSKILLPDKPLH